MTVWTTLLLGLIQGLCEFLPVSSSGHLALAHSLAGLSVPENALAFDVLLHLGTLAAVFVWYRKDVVLLIRSFFTLCGKLFSGKFRLSEATPGEKMLLFLLLAALPLIPAAFLSGRIEALMTYPLVVGLLLMANGLLLFVSDHLGGHKTEEDIKPKNALAVGLFQLVALLPGISRSGATITGGLSQGFDRPLAVRFSFLLSMPAILGASLFQLPDFFTALPDARTLGIALIGALTAFLVGLLAIRWVNALARRAGFRPFAWYCLLAGLAVSVFCLVRTL